MKFKKYRIEVPNWGELYPEFLSRRQIRERVHQHAGVLGYSNNGLNNYTNDENLYFLRNGIFFGGSAGGVFSESDETLIKWQDFLKLTKGDVVVDETGPIDHSVNSACSYGTSETRIPYFASVKVDYDFMSIDNPIAAKVGQCIMIGNNSFEVVSIQNGAVGCKRILEKRYRRTIKLSMEG